MEKSQAHRPFVFWAIITIIVNLVMTQANSYMGDQGYWLDWVRQLRDNGFTGFNGNYPPLYITWLWVVGKLYFYFDLLLEKDFLLKFLCLWPVYIAHLVLVRLVWGQLRQQTRTHWTGTAILALTALNPALLIDGPVWGQVDIFPVVLAACSLLLLQRPQTQVWASLLFSLALLSKFQTIAFLPVFGGLFIRQYRTSWKGLPLATVGISAVLIPFLFAGSLSTILENAYLNTITQYPYSAYNAGNLWMLLQGNVIPETQMLWGNPPHEASGLGLLLTPKWLGKIFFFAFSVWVFYTAIRKSNRRKIFMLATLNALAFFTLLPGMHERYMLPVIPMALLWTAQSPRSWKWAAATTLLVYINIGMLNGIQGDALWPSLSALVVGTFIIAIWQQIFPRPWQRLSTRLQNLPLPMKLPYVLQCIALIALLGIIIYSTKPIVFTPSDQRQLLYATPPTSTLQNYREPQYGYSVDHNLLSVNGKRYLSGIGTHAPSQLKFQLPPQADSFYVSVGIDDEAKPGNVIFRILLDGREAWRSPAITHQNSPMQVSIALNGAREITLITDTNGPDSYDHADWLIPTITLK